MGEERQKISFVKMTGAGNDFVLVDELKNRSATDWARLAPDLCDRRYGIGADGLLVLAPSVRADFTMEYYNADGSFGGMCGNGGRCSAYYYISTGARRETRFEALGDLYLARVAGSGISLRMKDPVKFRTIPLQTPEGLISVQFIDTGAPHAVLFTSELPDQLRSKIGSEGITGLGRSIRYHSEFEPGGTNVDFVELIPGGGIAMRSYERGVEGETLACGTGAVASAAIAALTKGIAPPVKVKTWSDEILRIDFKLAGKEIKEVELEGPVTMVYKGELEYSPSAGRGKHGT